jgi:U3 small nucleolar RNA-associated protein 24
LFLAHNTALAPPYRVLIDTNFINFSLQNKLELVSGMMDCLYAKCKFTVHRDVEGWFSGFRYPMCDGLCYGRTRKIGSPISHRTPVCLIFPQSSTTLFSTPRRVARDPRFERLPCSHTGTYADDCLVQRVTSHRCYIVATCDRELRRRIRQIPGVPLMYIVRRRYAIERLPDQGAPV